MAIITVDIYNSKPRRDVSVTYDNEFFTVDFLQVGETSDERQSTKGNTVFIANDGYGIVPENSNIKVYRDDRGEWYEIGNPLENDYVPQSDIIFNHDGTIKQFDINVNVGATHEYEIDLTNSGVIELEPEPEPEPSIMINDIDIKNEHVTINLESGEIDLPYNLIITANRSYKLTGTGTIKFFDSFDTPVGNDITFSGNGHSVTVELPESLYSEWGTNEYNIVIEVNTVFQDVEQVSSFVNIYNVSDTELNDLASKRFYDSQGTLIDYGTYINNLYEIPFPIPESLISGRSEIRLGTLNTEIESDILNHYLLTVSLGEISIDETFKNALDYMNAQAELYLPYANSIRVDIDYLMNETISIEYIINLYSGEMTINLYSTFSDSIFHSENHKIGVKIPYITAGENNNQLNIELNTINNIKTPYVIITKEQMVDDYEEMGVGTAITGIIGNHSGYVEISEIDLDSKATNQEQSEIKNILSNGVYINGENS